ncbi:MAG: SIS domain-containing protein [Clostridium sp.]|nr:SIS domain-containing protein [Clostridium sp.]
MTGFKEKANLAMKELQEVFELMDDSYIRELLEAVKSHRRIFTIGAGREGLSTKAFAMRLTHLGKESHWIWDDTTPALGTGDLLIAVCGPGHIDTIDQVVRYAKGHGAVIAVISAAESGYCVEQADIVMKLPAAAYRASGKFVETKQPMGNLFEQALFIVFDVIVMMASEEMGIPEAEMVARHRNIE